MKIGTRSVLFGVHQFAIHPLLVALAWWKLYGFPWDARLWVAFFVHDLGYLGKPNMDGPEGERHTELGGRIMGWLFDRGKVARWRDFCLYHSRYVARRDGRQFSRLCVADKLAIVIMPAWLYLPLGSLSGEIYEYMAVASKRTAAGELWFKSPAGHAGHRRQWYADIQETMRRWVAEHRDGREDTWTPPVDLERGVISEREARRRMEWPGD